MATSQQGPNTHPAAADEWQRSLGTTAVSGRSISWLLERWSTARPDKMFLAWEPFDERQRTWTYSEFTSEVARVAGGLRAEGVEPGDRVLIHLDNCPEFLLTWFACAWMGAVAVCTNTRSAADELAYFASHSEATLLVAGSAHRTVVHEAVSGRSVPVFEVGDIDGQESPFQSFASLYGVSTERRIVADLDPALILYTSGTTGRPKAVVWTHANTMWSAMVNGAHIRMSSTDVTQVYLPLFHTNAQAYSVLPSLWAGATVVLQPRFSVSRFWPVAVQWSSTFASHINFALRALSTVAVPSNKFSRWGASVSGHDTESYFGVPTIGWYGMTETIAAPIAGDLIHPSPSGTIGRAAPFYEIAVVDEAGNPVETGESGELLIRGVRGLSLFREYLHDPEATAAALDTLGWFATGDRVTVRHGGAISFSDRFKDMLRIGGENVAASEIERVVLAVVGVDEVAVVAGPDPMLDEIPVAFIVPGRGVDTAALEASVLAAAQRSLADFKVPRAVRFVDDLPRATLSKVAKHELRQILQLEKELSTQTSTDPEGVLEREPSTDS